MTTEPDHDGRWTAFYSAGTSPSGKTKIWTVTNKEGFVIGRISWKGPWRKYVFAPADSTVWDNDCLHEVATFLTAMTMAHRSKQDA